MEISDLKEFIDLASTLSFSETSARMYISQSSLSKHIIRMEKELGFSLFIRDRLTVKLTNSGHAFESKIRPIIAQYDSALKEILEAERSVMGTLRVGFLDAAAHDLVSSSAGRFIELFPGIDLILHSGELGDLERALEQDEIDICISIKFANAQLPRGWRFEELFTDVIAAVVPAVNPLSQRAGIYFNELFTYPFVIPDDRQYPAFAMLIHTLFDKSGVTPKMRGHFSHINTAMVMVESGNCVSAMPKHVSVYPHTAAFVDILDDEAQIGIGAFWKSASIAPKIEHFISILANRLDEK